jgi:hypothetical protein
MNHADWTNRFVLSLSDLLYAHSDPDVDTIRAEIRQCYNMCSRRIDDLSESINNIQQTTGPKGDKGDKGDTDVSSVVDIILNMLDESVSALKNRPIGSIDEMDTLSLSAECMMFAEEEPLYASVAYHIV